MKARHIYRMPINRKVYYIILIVLGSCASVKETLKNNSNSYDFPKEFEFGVASASYQIEGGWKEDGKTSSIWDKWTHENPEYIEDRTNGDVACDSYHLWQEDIEMLKTLGVQNYRLSLSWNRILPGGYTNITNAAGVNYYNNIINALIKNKIEPIITINHWDWPAIFGPLGSIANQDFIKYFANFATTVFKLFGDRVKSWITFNEINVQCEVFYNLPAANKPDYPKGVVEYLCITNILKAHAVVYRIYRKYFDPQKKGKLGFTLNFRGSVAGSVKQQDIEAAERLRQFDFGLYVHPLVHGDFPQIIKDRVAKRSKLGKFFESRLPVLSQKEIQIIKGTYDFVGINHYTSYWAYDIKEPAWNETSFNNDMKLSTKQIPIWKEDGRTLNEEASNGLLQQLIYVKNFYSDPVIYITECGISDSKGTIDDDFRTRFYKGFLNATITAIGKHKVKVEKFIAWSFMDDFEWTAGYTSKYGLINVDFSSPGKTRTPKKSAQFFSQVATSKTLYVD